MKILLSKTLCNSETYRGKDIIFLILRKHMLDTLNSHDNYVCHCKLPCYPYACFPILNTMLRIVIVVPFFVAQTCIWHHIFSNEINPQTPLTKGFQSTYNTPPKFTPAPLTSRATKDSKQTT